MITLADLLMERFKVRTRAVENPRPTVTGAAAILVLSNNPNRLGIAMINLGANPIYVGLEGDTSATKGIRLDANGGSVSMIWDEDFQTVGWAWWAISPDGASRLYVLEVVSY